MVPKLILIVVVGLGIISCSPKEKNSEPDDEISGAYAREYSFAVTNPESGKEIGMRTIRDTISIRRNESGYEISNSKWSLNDYDKKGWKNMKHSDDRPMPTFQAKFDASSRTLISEFNSPLYLDVQKSKLSKNKSEATYQKIRQE